MTVPNFEEGERFFEKAFQAEVLYRGMPKGVPPQAGEELASVNGLPRDNAQIAISMSRIRAGANLELFEVKRGEGHSPNMAS